MQCAERYVFVNNQVGVPQVKIVGEMQVLEFKIYSGTLKQTFCTLVVKADGL